MIVNVPVELYLTDDVKYIAMDIDGDYFAYTSLPVYDTTNGCWDNHGVAGVDFYNIDVVGRAVEDASEYIWEVTSE